jgi:hypothetical protein
VFNYIGQVSDWVRPLARSYLEGFASGKIRKDPPEGGGAFAKTACATINRLHAKTQYQFIENPFFLIIKVLHEKRDGHYCMHFQDFLWFRTLVCLL